jgi:LSD1 subclass zinc finger protein
LRKHLRVEVAWRGCKDLDQACDEARTGDLDARTLLDIGPGAIFVDCSSCGAVLFTVAGPVALHFEGTLVLPGKGKSVASLIDASDCPGEIGQFYDLSLSVANVDRVTGRKGSGEKYSESDDFWTSWAVFHCRVIKFGVCGS